MELSTRHLRQAVTAVRLYLIRLYLLRPYLLRLYLLWLCLLLLCLLCHRRLRQLRRISGAPAQAQAAEHEPQEGALQMSRGRVVVERGVKSLKRSVSGSVRCVVEVAARDESAGVHGVSRHVLSRLHQLTSAILALLGARTY